LIWHHDVQITFGNREENLEQNSYAATILQNKTKSIFANLNVLWQCFFKILQKKVLNCIMIGQWTLMSIVTKR